MTQHKRRGATAKRNRRAGALARLLSRLAGLERLRAEHGEYLFLGSWGNEYYRVQREIQALQVRHETQ